MTNPNTDTTSNAVVTIAPPALPEPGGLHQNSKRKLSLSDMVQPIFEMLFDTNDQFRDYLEAVENDGAVEKNVKDDTTVAAMMIRDAAPEGSPVKLATLGQLRMALGSVMRRYGIGRTQRQRVYLTALEAAKSSSN
jgi:hypothetical protein